MLKFILRRKCLVVWVSERPVTLLRDLRWLFFLLMLLIIWRLSRTFLFLFKFMDRLIMFRMLALVWWCRQIMWVWRAHVDPPQGCWVGVEVSLENIGMTSRNVYLGLFCLTLCVRLLVVPFVT